MEWNATESGLIIKNYCFSQQLISWKQKQIALASTILGPLACLAELFAAESEEC